MTAPDTSAICLAALLAWQALWLPVAPAAPPGAPTVDEEVSKQEAIYQSRGEDVPAGYVIDRSLLSYASFLASGFDRSLANLGPTDRWLDIGAGQGLAILDYYTSRYDSMHPEGRARRGSKARAVAISIEDRRTPRWRETAARLEADQIRYLSGRRLREYSPEELGRFQLITDFTGGFSYTRRLSLFMEKVLGLLEVNGSFYTLLLDVRPEAGTTQPIDPESLFLTEIESDDGSDVAVCSWLKSISCVKVACKPDTKSSRPVELYRIQKVCNDVAVPSLVTLRYRAGTPPQRRFSMTTPPPESR